MLASILVGLAVLLPAFTASAGQTAHQAEPLTLAFYYPWYGSPDGPSRRWVHWQDIDPDARTIANSGNFPTLGAYDSHDPAIVAQHMQWAHKVGLDGLVVSWWGEGGHEDRAIPLILDEAAKHDLRIALYIERTPGDRTGPEAGDATADEMLDLGRKYGTHPAFLRVDGRPVLFAYVRVNQQLTDEGWKRVFGRLQAEADASDQAAPIIIGDRPPRPIRALFDGWHTYDPMGQIFHERGRYTDLADWAQHVFADWIANGKDTGGITCVTICPGYDDRYFRKPGVFVERNDGQTYRTLWEQAIAADPDWVLITSFNEWHETSEIEPSIEHGEQYLEITREMNEQWRASRGR